MGGVVVQVVGQNDVVVIARGTNMDGAVMARRVAYASPQEHDDPLYDPTLPIKCRIEQSHPLEESPWSSFGANEGERGSESLQNYFVSLFDHWHLDSFPLVIPNPFGIAIASIQSIHARVECDPDPSHVAFPHETTLHDTVG
jgi:hypothetical protein